MKPDDVTQEAWEQAETHRQLWARGPCTIKEAVARAITAATAAEREACALVAAQFVDGRLYKPKFPACSYHAQEIGEAIRARSKP